jgi:hypothetical protein
LSRRLAKEAAPKTGALISLKNYGSTQHQQEQVESGHAEHTTCFLALVLRTAQYLALLRRPVSVHVAQASHSNQSTHQFHVFLTREANHKVGNGFSNHQQALFDAT